VPKQIHDIILIGAGSLAGHLGIALHRRGLKIVQVVNRTPAKGRKLAAKVGASYCENLSDINRKADLYMLAVSDTYLAETASLLRLDDRLTVHASGSQAMEILAPVSRNIGVFYPVQTFSNIRRIGFSRIPVCIEANSEDNEFRLKELAARISGIVHCLNSEQRNWLHLGAVFASNFPNHLYGVAEDLLLSHDIPPKILNPLISQTAGNWSHGNPFSLQTGPAVRNDRKVLAIHREMLERKPEYRRLYDLLTESIIKQHPPHDEL